MFVLSGEITIGNYLFKQFHQVKITRSVDSITDKAVISLPTRFVLRDSRQSHNTEQSIKVGDEVHILLRYENVFEKEEFIGYVTKIKPNTPVEIECEDEVYKLRKKTLNKNFSKTTLKEVMQFIVSDTSLQLAGNIPSVGFDKFILKNVNGAQALEKIKKDYGLTIYLDDNKKLFAGLQQTNNATETVLYDLDYNVISQNLEYVKAEDVRIRLKIVGMKKDNTKVVVEIGDPDGELRTETVYSISDKKELEKIGRSKLKNYQYSGYRGTIASFFYPYATRGMACILRNAMFPEREGRYFIPKVEIEFGQDGGRRTVTLGESLGKKVS